MTTESHPQDPPQKAGDLSLAEANRQLQAGLERHRAGDIESAYRTYLQVLARYPNHATALHYLGLVAQQTGRSADAARLLRRSIELDPHDPRAYNHLGQVVFVQGRLEEAIAWFERALAVDPRHVDSLNNLANVVKSHGELHRAIDLYRQVLKIDSHSTMSLYNLANALKEAEIYDESLQMFERALACDDQHVPSHLGLGVLLEQKGRFDEAIGHYQSILRIEPQDPRALARLMAMPSFSPDPALVERAERLLEARDLDSDACIKLHYGLGKYYDTQQKFDTAFRHFSESNAVVSRRSGRYDPKQVSEYCDRIIETFSAEYFTRSQGVGSLSERPIFVVGMPRSGSTLTEQILASHPAIFGAGELQDIPKIVKGLRPHYPEALLSMPKERVGELADRYLAGLDGRAPVGALRVTDKLPVNFTNLGLIATLFPRARVIHCQRHPLDIGLSCFIERFDLQRDFTTDLESFGHYFLQYARLMEHWRKVLPLPMHEHRYESQVGDPQGASRALISFCGLQWDDSCMDFQNVDRTVLTPSRWQVRQRIYESSVGRWRNYANHLETLRRMLSDYGYRYE